MITIRSTGIRQMAPASGLSQAVFVKELGIHDDVLLDSLPYIDPKAVLPEKIAEAVTVDQLDRRRSIT